MIIHLLEGLLLHFLKDNYFKILQNGGNVNDDVKLEKQNEILSSCDSNCVGQERLGHTAVRNKLKISVV